MKVLPNPNQDMSVVGNERKRRWTVAELSPMTRENGLDVTDGLGDELSDQPSVVYLSNDDDDPMVAMRMSQLRQLVSCSVRRLSKVKVASHSECDGSTVPVPEYEDTVQLSSTLSKEGGGFLRTAAPLPNLPTENEFIEVDAKGSLRHEETHFQFHSPVGWMPTTKLTEGCLLMRRHATECFCVVPLEDATVGLMRCNPNDSKNFPQEARLAVEAYGADKSSYTYRIRFLKPHHDVPGMHHYLGALGNGTAGVCEEHVDVDFAKLETFFRMNCLPASKVKPGHLGETPNVTTRTAMDIHRSLSRS